MHSKGSRRSYGAQRRQGTALPASAGTGGLAAEAGLRLNGEYLLTQASGLFQSSITLEQIPLRTYTLKG